MRLTEGHAWWKEPGHSYSLIFLIGNFRRGGLARELLVVWPGTPSSVLAPSRDARSP